MGSCSPLLIGVAVDVVVEREDSLLAGFGVIDPWHQLILSVLTFLIWGLESIFEYWYESYGKPTKPCNTNCAWILFHMFKNRMSWFDEQKGDLMAIMNDDINQLGDFWIKVQMIYCRYLQLS